MTSLRRQTRHRFSPTIGWTTLLLFVAYLVYMPVHLTTEAHCLPAGMCEVLEDHHHGDHTHVSHDPGHHSHDGPDHHPHNADEHDLKFTGKNDSLKLSLCFITSDSAVILLQPRAGRLLRPNADQILTGLSPGSPLQSRAPPVA